MQDNSPYCRIQDMTTNSPNNSTNTIVKVEYTRRTYWCSSHRSIYSSTHLSLQSEHSMRLPTDTSHSLCSKSPPNDTIDQYELTRQASNPPSWCNHMIEWQSDSSSQHLEPQPSNTNSPSNPIHHQIDQTRKHTDMYHCCRLVSWRCNLSHKSTQEEHEWWTRQLVQQLEW